MRSSIPPSHCGFPSCFPAPSTDSAGQCGSGLERRARQRRHPVCEDCAAHASHVAALAGTAVFWELSEELVLGSHLCQLRKKTSLPQRRRTSPSISLPPPRKQFQRSGPSVRPECRPPNKENITRSRDHEDPGAAAPARVSGHFGISWAMERKMSANSSKPATITRDRSARPGCARKADGKASPALPWSRAGRDLLLRFFLRRSRCESW